MSSVTQEYLDLYNKLEHAIKEMYDVPEGIGPIAWLAREERGFRGIRKELDYCREVRNLLQHSERVNGEYAVVPSQGMLKLLSETFAKVANVPRAIDLCVRAESVFTACMEDPIRPAMREMADKGYTHVPILEDGRVVGAFSENTLLTYMNSGELVEIGEDDTFGKMGDLLPLDSHESETFGFVSRDEVAPSIAELFQSAWKTKKRLGMLFVTANGKQSERMLGVLTSWDLAAFF